MNLIALLIGLAVEHLATRLFHLRELRWLDRVIDFGFRQAERFPKLPPLVPVALLAALLVLPVLIATFFLRDESLNLFFVLFAIFVLFFSFGPNDIGEEVDEYCAALETGDEGSIQHTARAIVEKDLPADPLQRIHCVEEAVYVQANNRLFAVIFWFLVLALPGWGPFGAWGYRVTDLIRRRAVFKAARHEADDDNSDAMRDAAVSLHGWLAWIPARLTAIGYAIAGHFDAAIAAWRAPDEEIQASLSEHSERLLARVGAASLALQDKEDEDETARGVRGAMAANRLVFRLFVIWAVIIAAMTLSGVTV